MDIQKLLIKAGSNSTALKLLNPALWKVIPFNKPHRLKVEELSNEKSVVKIPWRKSNFNHLNGIHAMALGTASEYCSGLLILRHLGTKDYRLIMRSIKTEYHYQAKTEILVSYQLSSEELKKTLEEKLASEPSADLLCEIHAHDTEGNHVCTTYCDWQIKRWDKVKTRR